MSKIYHAFGLMLNASRVAQGKEPVKMPQQTKLKAKNRPTYKPRC